MSFAILLNVKYLICELLKSVRTLTTVFSRMIYSPCNHLLPLDKPVFITKGLYFGSQVPAENLYVLKAYGITHIVNLATRCKNSFPDDFKYLSVNLEDQCDTNLLFYLFDLIYYIRSAIRQNGTVYVHCNLGISRSASVVIAYLIATELWSYGTAFTLVHNGRPIARPNPGFVEQLRQFDKIIRGDSNVRRSMRVIKTYDPNAVVFTGTWVRP